MSSLSVTKEEATELLRRIQSEEEEPVWVYFEGGELRTKVFGMKLVIISQTEGSDAIVLFNKQAKP